MNKKNTENNNCSIDGKFIITYIKICSVWRKKSPLMTGNA